MSPGFSKSHTHRVSRTIRVEICMSKRRFDGSQQAGRVHDVDEFRRSFREPVGGEGKHGSCEGIDRFYTLESNGQYKPIREHAIHI